MNTKQAKAIAAESLNKHGVPFSRMTAKSVGFSDLMRASRVVVSVYGLTLPDTRLQLVDTDCKGFGVQYYQAA